MNQQLEDTNKCAAGPNCSSTTVETRIAIRRIVWYTPLGTFLLAVAISIGLGVSLKAWNVSPSNDIHTDTGIIVSTSTGILSKREEEYSLQRELKNRVPTPRPTQRPTYRPTRRPTSKPIQVNPLSVKSSTRTIFCVIGDVPYNLTQVVQIHAQISTMSTDCEFLVHVGDIKKSDAPCIETVYSDARSMLLKARMPTFIVLGDNEWNDCPKSQVKSAWNFWNQHLLYLSDAWNHGFTINRLDSRPENFYFVHKKTLFLFLNIVGGAVIEDWDQRHADMAQFTVDAITQHVPGSASGVVIMAQAHPKPIHDTYFLPVTAFVEESSFLNNVPLLYIHGDGHKWEYEKSFSGLGNMLRMQVVGGSSELPLKMIVDPFLQGVKLDAAFQYLRVY